LESDTGGVIQGSLAIASFEPGAAVKSQLQLTGVNLQPCLAQLFGFHQLEGTGNVSVNIEGMGQSVLALTRTLNGTVSLTGENGTLRGLNVEKVLRRLERRPLSGGGDFRTGSTPYNKITVGLKIKNGTVTVDDVKVDSPAVKVSLAGSASIPARELDLTGSAALLNAASPSVTPFELPFVVRGSWDDPIMLPDPEALIRHSGAAAPLLRAIRDHETSDNKVRSVIERLTGAPAAGVTPGADHTTVPTRAAD
jgi:AsmA protein